MHSSLYRAANLTFPRNISGLSEGGSIKTEMSQGSMGEATGVLTFDIFILIE